MSIDNESYSIFGEKFSFEIASKKLRRLIESELHIYERSDSKPEFAIRIDSRSNPLEPPISQNPKSHCEFPDGFCQVGKLCKLRWRFEGSKPKSVDLSLREFDWLLRTFYKWKNLQFTTRSEMIGQILHELILIPYVLLSDQYAAIHSSSVIDPSSGRPILIGGTGGSGKTSLMLEATLRHGWLFAADDISVLSANDGMYPNFAFPKIYGYNLKTFPELKPLVLATTGLANRFHWKLHALNGDAKTRRRVNPAKLFDVPTVNELPPPSHYLILVRQKCSKISLTPLSTVEAARLSSMIMTTEYSTLTSHLAWSYFNRVTNALDPYFKNISAAWSRRTNAALGATHCSLMRIPASLSNREFLDAAWPILRSLGDRRS